MVTTPVVTGAGTFTARSVTVNYSYPFVVLGPVGAAFGGMPVVCYALVTRAFAPELAGRVNTTLNLICMLIAFVVQATIGPALAWMEAAQGLSRAGAHQIVTVALLAIQAAIWLWFAASREARDLP